MGSGKNAQGGKKIVRAPATKFAHLQKKAAKNRPPAKNLSTGSRSAKNLKKRG